MADKLNKQQSLAVNTRNKSILVSAPAGSGKTKILVSRIISLITNDYYDITDLLVLTFTKAAALEMKQRLIKELDDLIATDLDEKMLQHLLKQKTIINDAYITNFHSFCSDLLSQYGLVINVSDFTILERTALLKSKVFDSCLNKWSQDKKFYEFVNVNYSGYTFNKLKEDILYLENLSNSLVDFISYYEQLKKDIFNPLCTSGNYQDSKIINDYLTAYFTTKYQESLQAYHDLVLLCNVYNLDKFYESGKNLSTDEVIRNYLQYIETLLNNNGLTNYNYTKAKSTTMSWKEVQPNIKKEFEALKKSCFAFDEAYNSIFSYNNETRSKVFKASVKKLDFLIELMFDFKNEYKNIKTKNNYLDFNDLEQYTLKLLEPKYGVSQILYNSLKEVMIDEYQDTNNVQETLINKITNYQTPIINKFMVGDMKQSIYRFRNADLDIFNHKYQTYNDSDDTIRIDLGFNYRSDKVVLDSINYIFNMLMDKSIGGLDYYHDEGAKLHWDYEAKGTPSYDPKNVSELLLVYDDKFDHEYTKGEYEAMLVAQRINKLILEDGYHYNDIVVLMRSVESFITYKKVFNRYSIPSSITLTKGYLSSPEIVSCIEFLKAINNQHDDIALTSLLFGKYTFSNFDPNLIYKVKQKKQSMYDSLVSYVENQKEDYQKIQDFLDIYTVLKEKSYTIPVYQLLEEFLDISQYHSFVSGLFNGWQRYNNILLFKEILKNDQELSLNDIINNIQETIDYNLDYQPASVSQANDCSVSFMTIHKSKGLQFPVVFVCNTDKSFNMSDTKQPIIYGKELGLALNPIESINQDKFKNISVEYNNDYRSILAQLQSKETVDEEIRILYVALTRSVNKLILTGTLKDLNYITKWQQYNLCNYDKADMLLSKSARDKTSYLDWLGASIINHPDVISDCIKNKIYDSKLNNSYDFSLNKAYGQELLIHASKLEDDTINQSHFKLLIYDPSTIEEGIKISNHHNKTNNYKKYDEFWYQSNNLDKTIAVTKIIEENYPELDIKFTRAIKSTLSATQRGTLIHDVLERLPIKENLDLSKELDNLYSYDIYNDIQKELINKYHNHIQNYLDSDVYKLCLNSVVYKEKKFSFKNENNQIIHGIFDVIAIHDNKVSIIDYKTDNLSLDTSNDILEALHKGQMDYYKEVVKKIFPNHQVEAIVYYIALNKYVII